MFMTQTYATCPVHFTHLNFNFDKNIRLNTKYFDVHYAYSATSYYYPSTLYRSQVEVFYSTLPCHTLTGQGPWFSSWQPKEIL